MKLEVRIKPDSLTECLQIMDALDKAGLSLDLASDEPNEVEITPAAEVEKPYGKTVEPAKPAAPAVEEFDVVEEPKAEPAKPEPPKEVTVQDLRAAVRELIGRGGDTSWLRDCLDQSFGVESVNDLNATQRASLLEIINAR